MTSDFDDDSSDEYATDSRGRVATNGLGHQVWEGTIRTVKLSLMKTGLFYKSEAQQRLMELRDRDSDELSLEPTVEDTGGGFDPYNSSRKR